MGANASCGGCARRRQPHLTEAAIAQALLLMEERLSDHESRLQALQVLAEEAERTRLELEEEAAQRWLASQTLEDAAVQTPPIWAAELEMMEDARRARERAWGAQARRERQSRSEPAPAASSSRVETPRGSVRRDGRGPRLWDREMP